nr:glucose dehydrogenase [FAD, quinone]-like [Halyomorpha halys]
MLGGTGAMTGMTYMRGHKDIFNGWAKNGNGGWSYEACLPFFKKSENNKNPDIIEKEYHGTDGPLVVQQFPYQPQFAEDLLRAVEEIGYRVGDLNGVNQTGISVAQKMVEDGVRSSTSRAYLRPHLNRKNLVIKINSRVTRVLINQQSKRAEGVVFIDLDGTIKCVLARKEVILSAGTFGSPHLLLLSGVGPKVELEKLNIKVIQNLNVGQNLHNHVSVSISIVGHSTNSLRLNSKSVLREYLDNGTGPLSSTGLTQVTGFLKSKYTGDIPDLQVWFDSFSAGCPLFQKDGNEANDDNVVKIKARPANVLPRSKGYLTLKSNDPLDYPLIYPNYLAEERDVDILVDGIKTIIQIIETNALKKYNLKVESTPKEKCAHLPFAKDQYWKCLVKWYTETENHSSGTCKMGPSPTDAVVDPELRVHGIPNLRVIDESIFPYGPNSNPIASIVMVAEKGSCMIQRRWNKYHSRAPKCN